MTNTGTTTREGQVKDAVYSVKDYQVGQLIGYTLPGGIGDAEVLKRVDHRYHNSESYVYYELRDTRTGFVFGVDSRYL